MRPLITCWLACALTLGSLGLGGVGLAAPCPNPAVLGDDPPGRHLSLNQRQAVLAEVNRLVLTRALDPSFHGHDWPATFARARREALAAPDDRGFYRRLRTLTSDLQDGHLDFLSPADVAEQARDAGDGAPGPRRGQIGLTTEGLPDGRLRVQAVWPDTPAARAGLRPNDLILSVNGHCPLVEDGPVGSVVQLTVRRPGGSAHRFTLVRQATPDAPLIAFSRLRADPRVGYLRFDTFWPDQMGDRLQSAIYLLTQPGPLRGLVLDLRSNAGGQLYELQRFLGILVPGTVGQYRDRQGAWWSLDTVHTVGEAVDRLKGVPIVVLVSGTTQSGGEVAAAVLRHALGARVLGQPTPGLTSVASLFPLPDGSELQLPTAELYLGGRRLGGVVPDRWLPATTIRAPDQDPAVQSALRELLAMPRR